MKKIYSTLSALLFIATLSHAQGTLIDDTLSSAALGTDVPVDVYLPANYSDTGDAYNVIIFLHGAGGNQDSYGDIIPLLDGLISGGVIEPTIVVKPAGNQGPYGSSFYTTSTLNGLVEPYIVDELTAWVDAKFNTHGVKEKRCIMGHSMGGFGSMRLGLRHTDMYAGIAAHSGPHDIKLLEGVIPFVIAENDTGNAGPPYSYSPIAGTFSGLMFAMGAAFTPNLSNPPFYVNLPVDEQGNTVQGVLDIWQQNSPYYEAGELKSDEEIAIYLDCGESDELGVHALNVSMHNRLNDLNRTHTWVSYAGGHSDKLAERFPVSFAFLDSVMASYPDPTPEGISDLNQPLGVNVYPNPSNGIVEFRFTNHTNKTPELRIYDNQGRMVISEKLVNQNGQSVYRWNGSDANGSDVSGGIYHYVLSIGDVRETGRVVRM